MNIIRNQALIDFRELVINQARYTSADPTSEISDLMYEWADVNLSDEETEKYLKGKPILDDANMLGYLDTISLKELYRLDTNVDHAVDYIHQHEASCAELWGFIEANARQLPPTGY